MRGEDNVGAGGKGVVAFVFVFVLVFVFVFVSVFFITRRHLPICGVRTTLEQEASGWFFDSGSGVITSRPAPPIFPDCEEDLKLFSLFTNITWSASTRASWSTSPPLEVLMMQEDELILANRLRDTMPSVVGFRLAHLRFSQI